MAGACGMGVGGCGRHCAAGALSRILVAVIQSVYEIVAEVIGRTGKDKSADAALRDVLKPIRDLAPFDVTAVAKTVFIYYRWHGWLRDERGLEARIRLALRLDERFRLDPMSIPPSELRAGAVPAWTAECLDLSDEWLRSLQREPKLWLRAKRGQAGRLAEKLIGAEISPLFPEALLYRGGKDLYKTPEFHAGEFEIQDLSSQMVGRLCAAAPGETWWDTCAGEGGKTLLLSDLMQTKGMIWASDRAHWRLKILKRRAARAQMFNYRSAAWDGGEKPPVRTKFDGVLVDAPCSGIGTWQRDPYSRWTASMNDVLELSVIQRNLLAHVAPSVKPGGKLIYSVCTVSRAETTETVEMFNASQPDFEPLVFPDIQFNQRSICGVSSVTIWPSDLDANGMFIAGWRRKKGS